MQARVPREQGKASEMDTLELRLPSETYRALKEVAAACKRSEADLALEALQQYLGRKEPAEPLEGLFGEDASLLDEVTQSAMADRETGVWRWRVPADD